MFSGGEVNVVLGSLPLAIVTTDAAGLIVAVNRAGEELFEYESSAMVGNPIEMLLPKRYAALHKEHYRKFQDYAVTRAMGQGRELLAVKNGGQEFPVEVGITVMDTEPALYLASVLDISLRKQTEKLLRERQQLLEVALQEARRTLEEEVAERTRLEERTRLGRELHDSLSQNLYGIGLGLRSSLTKVRKGDSPVQALEYCLNLTEASLVEMRALLFKLRPKSLENVPIEDVLSSHAQAVAARTKIPVEFVQKGTPRGELDFEQKYALFRIATEALHNCMKHARAGKVELLLEFGLSRVHMVVKDDGQGIDTNKRSTGLGMSTMRERAEAVGGKLLVDTGEQGTSIAATIPWTYYKRQEV